VDRTVNEGVIKYQTNNVYYITTQFITYEKKKPIEQVNEGIIKDQTSNVYCIYRTAALTVFRVANQSIVKRSLDRYAALLIPC